MYNIIIGIFLFKEFKMNIDRLMGQLKIDEGYRRRVYKDTEGLLTVGIGHLIKPTDPDWLRDLQYGDKLEDEQIEEIFLQDLAQAIGDAKVIFGEVWEDFPDIIQEVFINMIFNLGRSRFLKFKKTIMYAYQKDWKNVAEEMLDSRWARQVGQRAYRLSAQVERA